MDTLCTDRASRYRFFGVCTLLFLGCAALTFVWHDPLSAMGALPMCDGAMAATADMLWPRLPEQTWTGAAASFLCMWIVMMTAMMLPAVAATLWRYRQAAWAARQARDGGYCGLAGGGAGLSRLAALAAAGYFAVWAALGAIAYPLGAAVAALQRGYPVFAQMASFMAAGIVAAAGALQFTGWKMRHLGRCRHAPIDPGQLGQARGAWRHGLRLGWHCIQSCAGWTAVLLVTGLMHPASMAAAGLAITAERLAPDGRSISRATGAVLVLTGLLMMARAGLG